MGDQPEHRSIVVTGVLLSGRSTFVNSLSELPHTPPEPGQVFVAMDFGRIDVEDGVFYIFGAPDGRRFDMMYEIMSPRLLGWIVLIDSSRPETFHETNSIITTLMEYPLHIIVAATFQDQPDAWDVEALQIMLHIPLDIPVIPCVTTNRESVKNVLLAFCAKLLENVTNEGDTSGVDPLR